MMKSILILVLLITSDLSGLGQSDSTSKNFRIEIGHNYFPRQNIYIGFKKEIFNSKKLLFRSGIIQSIYPKYEKVSFTGKYNNTILSAGLEYHFFDKVKWFSPYAGLEILNYHQTEKKSGKYSFDEKENAFGGVFIIGTQFNIKKFQIGVEVDLGYSYTTHYFYMNPDLNYDVNYWSGWQFRLPLIYIGYKF